MKSRKGLTLIEVLLSLFLIGIIATTFIPAIFSNFSMVFKAKDITENIFAAKQNMERAMELARREENKSDPRFTSKSFTLFGKTIDGTLIHQPISGDKKIVAYVPNESVPVHEVPRIKSGSVSISPPGPIYGFLLGQNLTGSEGILESNSNYYMKIFNWYVSKPGFEGFIPENIDNTNEGYFGRRYPQWPQDYIKIKSSYSKIDGLNSLEKYVEDYQGRHIVFSVIPVSTIGKYGTEIPSQPVYLIGLPILNPLIHLDADTIQEEINDEKLLYWSDISKDRIKTNEKIKIKYDEELGKFVEINNKVTISENLPLGEDITIFIVFNNTSLEVDKIQNLVNSSLGNNLEWQLNMNKGKIEFIIGKEENQIKLNTETFFDNNKHILVGQISKRTNGEVKLFVDNEVISFVGNTNIYSNSLLNLTIGSENSELNMYEIIIYNSILSEEQIDSVKNYLSMKHKIELK